MSEAQLRSSIHSILKANRHVVDGNLYTVPSPASYPYQWLWDSCFAAITLSYLEPLAAQAELSSLMAKQWENGMVPHIIYWKPNATVLNVDWGVPDTSTLTQPPLIAHAVWQVFEATQDTNWLATLYPRLLAYHEYLLTRRQDDRGLIGIINPDESGEDNSPRFDAELQLPPQHPIKKNMERRFALFDEHRQCGYDAICTANSFWVEDVPFNVFTILSIEALTKIAMALADKPIAERLTAERHHLAHAMRTHLLQDDGIFRSVHSNGERRVITVDTWAQFAPLMVGLHSKQEAQKLIEEHYFRRGFATPYRLPTLSSTDPAFSPQEPTWGEIWQHPNWRGAIWMASNWCVYHGLKRYGYHQHAKRLRTDSIKLITQSGFRENYHPITGAGQGAHGFTWGGLVLDMH